MNTEEPSIYARRTCGLAMIVAPLVFLTAELLHAHFETDAGRYLDGIAAGPDRWYAAHMLVLLGLVLILPALAGAASLTRASQPRLTAASATLIIPGTLALATLVGIELVAWQLAQSTIGRAELIAVWENTAENEAIVPLVGVAMLTPVAWLLAGIALVRARAVARWSAVLVGGAQLVGFAGELSGGPKWIAVGAQLAFAAGLVPIGLRVLRDSPTGVPVTPQARAAATSR